MLRGKPELTRTTATASKSTGAIVRGILIAAAGLALVAVGGCSHESADDYLSAGDQAVQNNKFTDAEMDYQQAVKAAPNDPRTHVALGNLYVLEQKPEPAEIEFMKVIDLDPNNAAAHAALGGVYGIQNKDGLAEAQLRAAVVLDPANVGDRLKLGEVLQKQGKLPQAEAELRTATGLQPKNARAHLELANLLNAETGRQEEAQAEYDQVRALDPSLLPSAAAAPSAAPSPEAMASPAESPGVAPATAPLPSVRDIDKKWKLTHDSPVYETPSEGANTVAQVHSGKWVHVTGIAGRDWLRVALRNGTVGFIPITAAE